MKRSSIRRAGISMTVAMAVMPATGSAAILFQQSVDPVNGVAHFSRGWLSTAPGVTWIGIDTGQLVSAEASIGADYLGLFWTSVPDYSEVGSHPELYTENYFTNSFCKSTVGNEYCSDQFAYNNVMTTRMNGSAFEIDWKGYKSYNNCYPFNGIYDVVCARFAFNLFGGNYNITANATDRVTFTIYDSDPTNGAIPEPATWAMLIAGFGLTGAVLRRQAAMRA